MNSVRIDYKINDLSSIGLKFLKESYEKHFYYPYYYKQYPHNDVDGETLLSSLPNRYDYSLSYNSLFKQHSLYLGAEYSQETYQSFNIFSQSGLLAEPSIFDNENIKSIIEYSFFLTDKFQVFNQEIVLGFRSTKYSSYNWRFIPSMSLRKELYGYNLR